MLKNKNEDIIPSAMQVFYAPGIKGEKCVLDATESKHCIKVLRLRKNQQVTLIDGTGNLYEGIIEEPDPEACVIRITKVTKDSQPRSYKLHLAVSPLKNPERFDWLIEKCVEIGVDEITPLICKNTEKKNIKTDRINKIIISAMKQSLKTHLTILNEVIDFKNFISRDFKGTKLIAHCSVNFYRVSVPEVYRKRDDALFLIGPEGDFTDEEIRDAEKMGYRSVHLGPSRLRTETAGIAACHSIYLLNQ